VKDPRPLVDLPDLNLWLALAWGGHRHHAAACRYWEEQAADTVLFTTVTALGLVRLLSQPRAMGGAVLGLDQASAVQAAFLEQPGVRLVDDAAASWPVFRQLLSRGTWPARLCTDVHLAAIAITAGWRLVSFDQDFCRFSDLLWLPLAGE
jgi:toxin-antitoxin system PIN domain toxin